MKQRHICAHQQCGCWLSPLRHTQGYVEREKKTCSFLSRHKSLAYLVFFLRWRRAALLDDWVSGCPRPWGASHRWTFFPPLLNRQALAIYLHLTHGPLKLEQRKHGWCHYLCTAAGGKLGWWHTQKKKQRICEEVINEVLCNFAKRPSQKREMRWVGRKKRKLFNRPNFTFASSNRTRCVCLSVPHSN